MELLISKTDVEKFFQVSIGMKEADFEKFILEAQMFDLKKLVPEKFLVDLIKNKTEENYAKVLAGGEYTYDEFDYEFGGLKAVIAHLTYAIYIFKKDIQDTNFGFRVKKSPQSDQVEYKERKDWHYKYKEQAGQLWDEIKLFIERTISDFPIWQECTVRKTGFRTKVIQ